MARTGPDAVSFLSAVTQDADAVISKRSKQIEDAAQERSPLRLFIEDIILLIRGLRLFPYIFLPRHPAPTLPGVQDDRLRISYGWFIIFLLTLLEIPILLLGLPAAFILPGWAFVAGSALSLSLIYALAWTTWGTLIVDSKVEGVDPGCHPEEKWFFLNGITTSHATLQADVNGLSATFGRPVTGVHNRSFGIPFDLIECLIQRSFSYHTSDVRVAAESLTLAIEDSAISKIVIIAHSQGGLILSLVLDRLYTILPAGAFEKLEIYTFGSAASFFHNPLVKHLSSDASSLPPNVRRVSKSATDPPALISTAEDDAAAALQVGKESQPEIPNRLIPIIEHYVNGWDMVPRWGVLYHILLGNGSDYSGRVFVHQNASGHLFDDHYLSVMFPLLDLERINADDPHTFLCHRVMMDDKAADQMTGKWWGVFRALTERMTTDSEEPPQAHTSERRSSRGSAAPRVKDLSRLWRYMGGGTVDS